MSHETQIRKLSKLVMEKRRRERINSNLNELRQLLIDARNLDEFQSARMEKAEILEMAVKHLKEIRRRRFLVNSADMGLQTTQHQQAAVLCSASAARQVISQLMKPTMKTEDEARRGMFRGRTVAVQASPRGHDTTLETVHVTPRFQENEDTGLACSQEFAPLFHGHAKSSKPIGYDVINEVDPHAFRARALNYLHGMTSPVWRPW